MWIFQFFKSALSESFDYFSTKIKGRFIAFAIQLVLSYIGIGIFTFILTTLSLPLFYGGELSFNLLSTKGIYDWLVLIDPVWTVTIVIGVNLLFRTSSTNKQMSFPDFYGMRSSTFWFELFVAIAGLSILMILYHKNELFYPVSSGNDLDFLLGNAFEESMDFLTRFIENWLYYISLALPIVAIVVLEIRERQRSGVVLRQPIWKILVAAVLLGLLVTWSMDALLRMFYELVLQIIYAPFEMLEIPMFLGIITNICFMTFKFIALAAVYHFIIQYGTKEVEAPVLSTNTSEDLLDI